MGLYLQQLEEAGIDYKWGEPETKIGHNLDWKGKLLWQRQALSALPSSEHVFLTDGWDVILQGNRAEIELKLPTDHILISGEKNCWPDPNCQHLYPMGPTPWMFVNSGCIVGKASDLLIEMERGFAEALPDLVADDQRFWTWLFLTGDKIRIDYNCNLFQSMSMHIVGYDFAVNQDTHRLFNCRTGTTPNFLHWNGGTDWTVQALRALGMRHENSLRVPKLRAN